MLQDGTTAKQINRDSGKANTAGQLEMFDKYLHRR